MSATVEVLEEIATLPHTAYEEIQPISTPPAPVSDSGSFLVAHKSYSKDRQSVQVVFHYQKNGVLRSLTRHYRRDGLVWKWGYIANKGKKDEKFVVVDTRDNF